MSQMKLLRTAVAIFFVVAFFSAGCALNSSPKRKPAYGHSLIHQSDNRYYYFTEAQIQRRMGNLDKAIVLLKKAIEMDPDSLYLKRELATKAKKMKMRSAFLKTSLKSTPMMLSH